LDSFPLAFLFFLLYSALSFSCSLSFLWDLFVSCLPSSIFCSSVGLIARRNHENTVDRNPEDFPGNEALFNAFEQELRLHHQIFEEEPPTKLPVEKNAEEPTQLPQRGLQEELKKGTDHPSKKDEAMQEKEADPIPPKEKSHDSEPKDQQEPQGPTRFPPFSSILQNFKPSQVQNFPEVLPSDSPIGPVNVFPEIKSRRASLSFLLSLGILQPKAYENQTIPSLQYTTCKRIPTDIEFADLITPA